MRREAGRKGGRATTARLTDEQLTERATKGGQARNSTDYFINKLVERAPALTDDQAAKLRTLLGGAR